MLRRGSALLARERGRSRSFARVAYQRFEEEPFHRSRTARLLAAGVAASAVVYVAHLEPVPGSHGARTSLHLLSADSERKLGEREAAKLQRVFAGVTYPPDAPPARRVRRVAARLLAQVKPGSVLGPLAHLKGMKWTFTTVESPEVNAFALPNGSIVVFTGAAP